MTDSTHTPIRIQRRRTKGWKMPANTVYVGRPTRWGNPYAIGEVNGWTGMDIADAEEARSVYAADLQAMQSFNPPAFDSFLAEIREHLGGKNLACWCPLDSACHADVLLDLANHGDA